MLARLWLAIAIGLAPLCAVTGDPGRVHFERGVEASRDGSYKEALKSFQQARNEGLDSATLHYNIGVVLFRLERLDEAGIAFRRAAEGEELRGPGLYNQGLVALAQEKTDAAAGFFAAAVAEARTDQIRDLARRQLARLDESPTPVDMLSTRAWISLAGGYDTNPVLEADNRSIRENGVAFLDALLWGDIRVTPPQHPDVRLEGLAALRRHEGESAADYHFLEAGVAWHGTAGPWRLVPALRVNAVTLGNDTVERRVLLALEGTRQVTGPVSLRLNAELARALGGSDYRQLDGHRHGLQVGLQDRDAGLPWLMRYELVYEDRVGLEHDNGFESRSPLRHGLTLGLDPRLTGPAWLELRLAYRESRYRERDREADGSSLRRRDRRLRASIGVNRRLSQDWNGFLRLAWMDNRSRVEAFEYTRTELMLGVDRTF